MSGRPVFGRDIDAGALRESSKRYEAEKRAKVIARLRSIADRPVAPRSERVLEIGIVGIPPRPNEKRRMHWHARADDDATWRQAAYLSGLDVARRSGFSDELPFPKAEVEYEFLLERASGDLDNLVAAAKPILDGIRDAGIIGDDSVKVVARLSASWRKAPKAGVLVRVRRVET